MVRAGWACSWAAIGCPPWCRRTPRWCHRCLVTLPVSADDNIVYLSDLVVYLSDLGLTRVDANLLEDGHEGLAKGVKGLLRLPDIQDPQPRSRSEAHVVAASSWSPCPSGLQLSDDLVVLFSRHRGGREEKGQCHGRAPSCIVRGGERGVTNCLSRRRDHSALLQRSEIVHQTTVLPDPAALEMGAMDGGDHDLPVRRRDTQESCYF